MQTNTRSFLIVLLIMLFSTISIPIAYGAWSTQSSLLIGSWGSGTTDFGLIRGDSAATDIWPISIQVFPIGKIFIEDDVNKRTSVYTTDGNFVENVSWNKTVTASYVEYERVKYVFEGALIGFGSNQMFWTKDSTTFYEYDASFSLQQSVVTRPLELGKITSKRLSSTQWHYEVEYNDAIYIYEGAKDALKEDGLLRVSAGLIMQNQNTKVIAYNMSGDIPVQPSEKKKYNLAVASVWVKPSDEFGPVRVAGVERLPTLVAQYGNAVLGPDGSIYAWMRTNTQYKILRWQWVNQ